jgi:hypothetical protein
MRMDKNIVYVVTSHIDGMNFTEGVFSTKEKAEKFKKQYIKSENCDKNDVQIEPWRIDSAVTN